MSVRLPAEDLTAAVGRAARLVYAILDGTLMPIDRVADQKPYYSGKHHRHGVNVQVLADPAGRLLWTSPALPGATHDIAAARTHGIIDALNFILDITVPAEKQEGGTMVIPGHGRLCDEADVVVYRDMVTIIRDRIQDMIKKGMTLDQVKAAKPTRDYDPLYGSTTGFWTTDMFVEAAYKSLSTKK